MNYELVQKQRGMMQMATAVMQDLINNHSREEIISNRLDGDSQLFAMLALFLYTNGWLTRENRATEKGKLWIGISHDLS